MNCKGLESRETSDQHNQTQRTLPFPIAGNRISMDLSILFPHLNLIPHLLSTAPDAGSSETVFMVFYIEGSLFLLAMASNLTASFLHILSFAPAPPEDHWSPRSQSSPDPPRRRSASARSGPPGGAGEARGRPGTLNLGEVVKPSRASKGTLKRTCSKMLYIVL